MTVTEHSVPDEVSPDAEAAVEAVYVAPDRADAPVSEVTERFLRAIIAQVPVEQIEELHLFSPLRQGTLETGIAVVAARVPAPVEAVVESDLEFDLDAELDTEIDAELEADAALDAADDDASLDVNGTVDVITDETVDALVDATVDAEVDVSVDAEVDESVDVTVEDITDATAVLPVDGDDESPYAADADATTELVAEAAGDDEITIVDASTAVHAESIVSDEASDDEFTEDEFTEDEVIVFADELPPVVPIVRHTVYTARYRYVIKGPERGKWETNVKAEAEAPLITVETVVRGVQRRAGEESEIIRFTGAQIARALRVPLR